MTRYCHLLRRPDLQVGQQVATGAPIALVGSSGHSSGPHLHFEVHHRTDSELGRLGIRQSVDTIPFLAARDVNLQEHTIMESTISDETTFRYRGPAQLTLVPPDRAPELVAR